MGTSTFRLILLLTVLLLNRMPTFSSHRTATTLRLRRTSIVRIALSQLDPDNLQAVS